MTEHVGQITHLFIKPGNGTGMLPCSSLQVKVGLGIDGDVNAQAMSPRQLLLVRQEDLDAFAIPPGALRENITVAGLPSDSVTPGALLVIGNQVKIRATFQCEACKRIAHVVSSLKSIEDKRGLLGVVLSDGLIQIGDRVTAQPQQFLPLSSVPYRRFLDFVAKIPSGKVVTYRQVVVGMGVAESYMRAIPMYIQRTSSEMYPLHRILDSEGKVISHVYNQQVRLASEGIQLIAETSLFGEQSQAFVPLHQYLWSDPTIYLS
jgi:alkylated DNA nucleotide flippase Atl1